MTGTATILQGLPGFLIAVAFIATLIGLLAVYTNHNDDDQGGFA